ncbi:hypothetical protein [Moraxella canis]|uniref:hypothetical protein n=1 Tax=Moraxella canis TaxID=90239 RepID=UPI000669523B|nr:hypothetical protein [Moraxella canis]
MQKVRTLLDEIIRSDEYDSYPVIDSSESQLDLSDQTPIHGYYKVFKLGLALPITPKVLPA